MISDQYWPAQWPQQFPVKGSETSSEFSAEIVKNCRVFRIVTSSDQHTDHHSDHRGFRFYKVKLIKFYSCKKLQKLAFFYNHSVVQSRKREKRLLVQFTLISSALILYYASFWAIPYWFAGSPGLVIITFFGISSVAVNPWTYLAFNKLMKAKAKHLIFDVLLRRNAVGDLAATGTQARILNVASRTWKDAWSGSCLRISLF